MSYDDRTEMFYRYNTGEKFFKLPYFSNGVSGKIIKDIPEMPRHKNCVLSCEASIESINALISLVRSIATNTAYDTNGDDTNSETWVPKRTYLKALHRLADESEGSREVIDAMDRAIRVLQASKDTMVDGRVVMWFGPGGENAGRYKRGGDRCGFWFDITFDNKPTNDSTVWTIEQRRYDEDLSRLQIAGFLHGCFSVNCARKGELIDCHRYSLCLDAWYCSRACQKADWKRHKEIARTGK